jgi:hypothetical protein
MFESTLPLTRACLAVAWLAAVSAAQAAPATALPPGWQPLAGDGQVLTGQFRAQGDTDTALLVRNGADGSYGLAVAAGASGQPAAIVKTFARIDANPPKLALVRPGVYKPACAGGESCAPLNIEREAISLCFGEASCEIVYFSGDAFREVFVTD